MSYKNYFLGPKAENRQWFSEQLQSVVNNWFEYRESQFIDDISPISRNDQSRPEFSQCQRQLESALEQLKYKLKGEVPTYTPRYIGQMISEISMPAILGHFAAMLHNPNNTSRAVSKVGSVIEDEAIAMLVEMVGYSENAVGHFTSGGTVANFEGIWRARFRMDHWLSLGLYLAENHNIALDIFACAHMGWKRFEQLMQQYAIDIDAMKQYSMVAGNPFQVTTLLNKYLGNNEESYLGPVVLVPGNKHFSWQKGVNIFGCGEEAFWSIELDEQGKLDIDSLKQNIAKAKQQNRPILMIVAVAGTTETGEIDPIDEVVGYLASIKQTDGIDCWLHIDAAYGGFLSCILNSEQGRELTGKDVCNALAALKYANSITLDPHKLGYIPYSCGAILVKDQRSYRVSSFKAPYIDRPDLGNDKWSATIEGSRSATGAAATWLTGKGIGFKEGGFSGLLINSMQVCRHFREQIIQAHGFVNVLNPTESNVLCFSIATLHDQLSDANGNTKKMFEYFAQSPHFSISKTILSKASYSQQIIKHVRQYEGIVDDDKLVLLRCVFMNPFLAEASIREGLIKHFSRELEKAYSSTVKPSIH